MEITLTLKTGASPVRRTKKILMFQRLQRIALCLPILWGATACQSSPSPQQHSAQAEGPTAVELVAEARQLIEQRHAELAEPLLERALAANEPAPEARIWMLRCWMDQGRSNDTLDAIDDLRKSGIEGPELEYLYGMAFIRRAQGLLAQGVRDSSPQMNFEDAAFRLGRLLKSTPERFPDAYQALAVAAWYNQDLETARSASEGAAVRMPESPRVWLQLGRVAMSQFSATRDPEASTWDSTTRAHHTRALLAFSEAIRLLGEPLQDPQGQRLLADAGIQLGHAYAWDARTDDAQQAYTLAIGWSPAAVNYRQIQGVLGSDALAGQLSRFHQALESGCASFLARFGPTDGRAAGLDWWLGWERLRAGFPVGSEVAFLRAVHINASFVNAWFYIAISRFASKNYAGGAEALAAGWRADSNIIVDSVLAERELNLWKLRRALSHLATGGRFANPETNRHAAMLARVIAEASPEDGWSWNNLGMFIRDQADAEIYSEEAPTDSPEIQQLHEQSYAAYQRSLALLPDDAGVVNDTAVLLHYYLKRDQEEALRMYAHASELAEAALLDETLSQGERSRLETALRDSKENRRLLLEELASASEPQVPAAAAAQ